MKTIIYLIIACLFCLTLSYSCQKSSDGKKGVILQTTDTKVSSQLLTQSAKIIANRLKTYGVESFDINIHADKGQIEVQMPDTVNLSEIEGLLKSKGELAFYETYNREEISDLLKNNTHLFELLKNVITLSPSDPRIGCATSENRILVEDYLKSNNLISNCRFLWRSKPYHESFTCLYALKINETGKSLFDRTNVETARAIIGKDSQTNMIEIKFGPSSVKVWADATRNNIGKSIAIVIDNQVIDAPVVNSAIENGECTISGNFTHKEVNYFVALVNEKLPLSFNLLK